MRQFQLAKLLHLAVEDPPPFLLAFRNTLKSWDWFQGMAGVLELQMAMYGGVCV